MRVCEVLGCWVASGIGGGIGGDVIATGAWLVAGVVGLGGNRFLVGAGWEFGRGRGERGEGIWRWLVVGRYCILVVG